MQSLKIHLDGKSLLRKMFTNRLLATSIAILGGLQGAELYATNVENKLFKNYLKNTIDDTTPLISGLQILGEGDFVQKVFTKDELQHVALKLSKGDFRSQAPFADAILVHCSAPDAKLITKSGLFKKAVPFIGNSIVFIGPKDDPANLRSAKDFTKSFCDNKDSLLINNVGEAAAIITEIMDSMNCSYVNNHSEQMGAIKEAAKEGKYTFFGLFPLVKQLSKMSTSKRQKLLSKIDIYPVQDKRLMLPVVLFERKGINESRSGRLSDFLNLFKDEDFASRVSKFRLDNEVLGPKLKDIQVWWALDPKEFKAQHNSPKNSLRSRGGKEPGSRRNQSPGKGNGRGKGNQNFTLKFGSQVNLAALENVDTSEWQIKDLLNFITEARFKSMDEVLLGLRQVDPVGFENPVLNPRSLARGGMQARPHQPRIIFPVGKWIILQVFGHLAKEDGAEIQVFNPRQNMYSFHALSFDEGKLVYREPAQIMENCKSCHQPGTSKKAMPKPIWQLGPYFQTPYGSNRHVIPRDGYQYYNFDAFRIALEDDKSRYSIFQLLYTKDSQGIVLEGKGNLKLAKALSRTNARRVAKTISRSKVYKARANAIAAAFFDCENFQATLSNEDIAIIEASLYNDFDHPLFHGHQENRVDLTNVPNYLDAFEKIIAKQNEQFFKVLLKISPKERTDLGDRGFASVDSEIDSLTRAASARNGSRLAKLNYVLQDEAIKENLLYWSFSTADQGAVPSYLFQIEEKNGLAEIFNMVADQDPSFTNLKQLDLDFPETGSEEHKTICKALAESP